MARIGLQPPTTPFTRLALWYSRRRYGAELQPLLAMAHQPAVLRSLAGFERGLARWSALDPRLKALAVMAAAHRIGCSWCTDFGYWLAVSDGLDEAQVRDVPHWRDSDRFDALDRAVLAYAEAISGEVGELDDAQVAWLRDRLGEPALVELTMMVAVENRRSRFNAALGLVSQGFTDRCAVAGRRA